MPLAQIFSDPVKGLMFIVGIVLAVTVHEFAHAKTAEHLGDPTPSMQGRVSLNPLAHLDLMGSLLFLLVGFGWGKPVQFDPYNLARPKRDAAIIAFAGPASNALIALICSALLHVTSLPSFATMFFMYALYTNVALGIFNLIPVSPLDGFKVVGGLLSDRQAQEWYGLERYGIIFLLALIFPLVGGRSMIDIVISPIVQEILTVLVP